MNLWTILFIFLGLYVLYIYVRYFAPLRKREEGFSYVKVQLDGSVIELSDDEKEYLNTEFHPNDSARPYIKSRYGSLTPDEKIHGFIERKRVPFWIKIRGVG